MKEGVRMGDCEVVGLAGLLDCFFLLGQDSGWMGWDGLGSFGGELGAFCLVWRLLCE
jgi:hypothetical protein